MSILHEYFQRENFPNYSSANKCLWVASAKYTYYIFPNTVKRLYFTGYIFRESVAKLDFMRSMFVKLYEEVHVGPGTGGIALMPS